MSFIARLMPAGLRARLRPKWYRLNVLIDFYAAGGRLRYDRRVASCVAYRRFSDNEHMPVVVRSYREFRRWAQFDQGSLDMVSRWLNGITDCEVYWDIGSANGLEGFFVNFRHGCNVVFVEPFAPSIETILKTIYVIGATNRDAGKFEVVQALCDKQDSFNRLVMHTRPVAGETENSAEGDLEEYCHGGRSAMPVAVTQWVPTVSLDSLHWKCGLPLPTHIKIDVDGFELRALAGAQELLESGHVRSWVIEVNDDHGPAIVKLLGAHGYTKLAEYDHGKPRGLYTADYLFVRDDLPHMQFS